MNLPVILDIAIGLIFIYLILSLLTAEIQELIATLLQWRAVHLRSSIENLLIGSTVDLKADEPEKIASKTRELVDELYKNPLIRNINQEAKGVVAHFFRKNFTWDVADAFRREKSTVFGNRKRSAPSYIPAETFATTLLEKAQITVLNKKLSELKLERFKQENLELACKILDEAKKIINKENRKEIDLKLEQIKQKLTEKLDLIVEDFKNSNANLTASFERIGYRLNEYFVNCQVYLPGPSLDNGNQSPRDIFGKRMSTLIQDTFAQAEKRVVVLGWLKPSLSEIIEVLNNTESAVYQEVVNEKKSATPDEIVAAINALPQPVKESLTVLARRAQEKVSKVEDEFDQFQREIEVWFDRSMDRASGVYKRNARGVAVLLGFLLALVVNADTIYMTGRLSKDADLRSAIAQNVGMVANNCKTLDCIRQETNVALEKVAFPIGWSSDKLLEQWQLPYQDNPQSNIDWIRWSFTHIVLPVVFLALYIWIGIKILLLPNNKLKYIALGFPFVCTVALAVFTGAKVILGWLLSAIAISMGAPFWFDLLGKVVNVRNTGPKPASDTKNQFPSKDGTASTQSGR